MALGAILALGAIVLAVLAWSAATTMSATALLAAGIILLSVAYLIGGYSFGTRHTP